MNRWRSPALFAVSVNSASGCFTQARLIRDKLKAAEDRWQCPVLTFAEDAAIGPGYIILTAGRKVYADCNSLVGGLYITRSSLNVARLGKLYGVEKRIFTTKKVNRVIDPLVRQLRTNWIQAQLQRQHLAVTREVLAARAQQIPREPKAVQALVNGKVYTGAQAVEAGLIDSLGEAHCTALQLCPHRSIDLYEARGKLEKPPLQHSPRKFVYA